MPKYFIPERIVSYCRYREDRSFIKPRELKPGELALFNKNALEYQYFHNCEKTNNRYGWIGEADTLMSYFDKEILPEN